MDLSDVLKPTLIWPRLESTTKAEIIHELAQKISVQMPELNECQISEILMERERLGSTGIQDGIAIPHGKVPALENIVVACGLCPDGVDFDSHDGKPTKIFFVLLAPEFAAGQHLKVLAKLSRILKSETFRAKLIDCQDSTSMLKIIVEEDKRA